MPRQPRAKILGVIAVIFSFVLAGAGIHSLVYRYNSLSYILRNGPLSWMNIYTFYAIAIPISLITLFVILTGFWIGFTILTIKVVPPMPEIVQKKDFSKFKAFILCCATLSAGIAFVYGIYIRNYWALAIPAAVITLVILGAVFWVGIAIITTRSTLSQKND